MKKLRILPMLLALLLLSTACGAVAVPKSADHLDLAEKVVFRGSAATAESRWNYEISTYTVTGEHYASDDPEHVLIRHSYQMPRMRVMDAQGQKKEQSGAASKAAREFNAYFESRLQDEVAWFDEMVAIAEEDYAAVGHEKDSLWQEENFCYSDETTLDFWTNDTVVCVTTTNYSYTGGAHPNVWRSAASFDLRTGKEVTLAEMTDDVARLEQVVAEELLRQAEERRVRDGEEPTEEKVAFFPDYQETLENWMERSVAFGDDGVTVIFAVYDITPYAAGEQVFTVPYELLKPCLNSCGRELLHLN